MKVDKILLPTDFSDCAENACDWAAFLARRHHAELHLLHVVALGLGAFSTFPDPSPEALLEKMEAISQNRLVKRVADLKSNLDTEVVHQTRVGGSEAEAILDYVAKNDIDLIVMGTHGRRGISHFFMGSVAESTLRLAPCPVVTVRAESRPPGERAMRRVLVPVDFSPSSRDAVRATKEIVEREGAEATLFHVVEAYYQPPGMDLGGLSLPNVMDELCRNRRAHLERMASELSDDRVALRAETAVGGAYQKIVEYAGEQDVDLIVMSAHGQTGLSRLILGSVAERVVRTAPCPVMTLRVD